MTERPILFSAPMVRAILASSKTQTRRAVAFPRSRDAFVMVDNGRGWWPYQSDDGESELCSDGMEHPYSCPYGQPGDRLYVRETWGFNPDFPGLIGRACYRADPGHAHDGIKWKPSIHMPQSASRITLEVTGVRVERLQDISEDDCWAEGIEATDGTFTVEQQIDMTNRIGCCIDDAKPSYALLWESINGPGSWAANPWVWAIDFRRIDA